MKRLLQFFGHLRLYRHALTQRREPLLRQSFIVRGALGVQRQSSFTRKCGFGWPDGTGDVEKLRPVPPDKKTIQGFQARVWKEPFLKGGPEKRGRAATLKPSACRVPCKKDGGLFRSVLPEGKKPVRQALQGMRPAACSGCGKRSVEAGQMGLTRAQH